MTRYENDELERLRRDHGWDIGARAQREAGAWIPHGVKSAELSYPNELRRRLAAAEDSSFWFGHRSAIVEDVLLRSSRVPRPSGFWEIGSGNGFVARGIGRRGVPTVAVEPGFDGATESAQRGVETIVASLEELNLPAGALPAAGAMDVIEHLEDPSPLLEELRRVLAPGGLLLLTVPAFGWLWSAYDEVAGHFRRYSAASIRDEAARHGFESLRVSYFMAPLVPPLYWTRARPYRRGAEVSREELLRRTADDQNPDAGSLSVRAMRTALWMEKHVHRRLNLPFGTSVIGLFRRRG